MAELTGRVASAPTPPVRAGRLGAVGLFAAAVVVAVLVGVPAAETPGVTTRESVRTGTTDVAGDDDSRNAAVSADGQWVAFDSAAKNLTDDAENGFRDVFLRNRESDETTLVSLTPAGRRFRGDATNPAISADGRSVAFQAEVPRPPVGIEARNELERIVYTSNEAGSVDVYTAWGDGSDPRHLTDTPEAESDPAFSPDRSRIAFSRNGDLWVVPADGGEPELVTESPAGTISDQLAWAPDGRRLVFRRTNAGPAGSSELFVVDLDAGKATPLNDSPSEVENAAWPDWSPDGQWIAFSGHRADVDAAVSSVFVVEVDHNAGEVLPGDVSRVTAGAYEDRQPRWHPWRETLVFARTVSEGDPSSIWMVDVGPETGLGAGTISSVPTATAAAFVEGTEPQRLTDDAGSDSRPAWTGEGLGVTFASDRSGDSASDLYRVPLDLDPFDVGGDLERVTEGNPLGGDGVAEAPHHASTHLGVDTPAGMSVTVRGEAGQPTPQGSVRFEVFPCGEFDAASCAPPEEGARRVGGLVPLTDNGDGTASATSLRTSAMTPPYDFTEPGSHCLAAHYSGDRVYRSLPTTDPDELCFRASRHEPTIAVDVDSEDDITMASVSVSGAEDALPPEGMVSFFLCGPVPSGAGCVEGGDPVGSVQPLDEGQASSSTSVTVEEPGLYCWRVEYAGDFGYHPLGYADNTSTCVVLGLVDQLEPEISGTIPSTGEVRPGTPVRLDATISLDPESATATPGRGLVSLCGPNEVAPEGCVNGGTLIREVALKADGDFSALAPGALTEQDGTRCFRIDYRWAADADPATQKFVEKSHTNNRNARTDNGLCFDVVSPPFDPATSRTNVFVHNRDAGETALVSPALDGGPADGDSRQPSISGDGRTVAFTSEASDLTADAGLVGGNVFVRDLDAGETTLASVHRAECPCAGVSRESSVSANGGFVAFTSNAASLDVANPADPGWLLGEFTQVLVRDLDEGVTRIESLRTSGQPGKGDSFAPSISADGSRVAFTSAATDLVGGDGNGVDDVFLRDRTTGKTTRVSLEATGTEANDASGEPSISTDGRTVGFASEATNLVADHPCVAVSFSALSGVALLAQEGSSACGADVYVHDTVSGLTGMVSVDADGEPPDGGADSRRPSLSGDGRYVGFDSDAAALVQPEGEVRHVYVRDRTPVLTLSPDPLAFGDLVVGTTSLTNAVTAANSGAGPLRVHDAAVTGGHTDDFAVDASECVDTTLHRGDECTLRVRFAPTAEGDRTAVLTVDSTDPRGRLRVTLTGAGTRARLAVPSDRLDFGERLVDTESGPRTATFRSVGTAPVTVADVAVGGTDAADFTVVADECTSAVLAPGQDCRVDLRMRPTISGPRAGRLVLTSSAEGSPHEVSLTGTGIRALVEASPDPVDFGRQEPAQTSEPHVVTLRSVGDAPVAVEGVSLAGGHVSDFAAEDDCTEQLLDPGDACTVTLRFTPSAVGTRKGTLVFAHNGEGDPGAAFGLDSAVTTVSLTGVGIPGPSEDVALLAVAPDPVDFGVVPAEQDSTPRTVTVTSVGTIPATIDRVRVRGSAAEHFAAVAAEDACSGQTLAPEATCELVVVFRPAATGSHLASLTVASDADDPPDAVGLRGLAPLLVVDPPLGPPGFVTGVTGSDFPAGTELVLAWKPGIGSLRVATDEAGGFRAHMLVLRRDQLGPRQVEARGEGFAIPADFLVVPGSAQPGDFQTRR